MFFYPLALLILLIDQYLKHLVTKSIPFGGVIPLLGNFLKLNYVRNTGAAFSLFIGFSPYLAVIGFLVVIVVIYLHYRFPPKNFLLQFGLACLLGGSVGNLADRLTRGYVVDYLDITILPVFNFADIMINFGVILIMFYLVASSPKKGDV